MRLTGLAAVRFLRCAIEPGSHTIGLYFLEPVLMLSMPRLKWHVAMVLILSAPCAALADSHWDAANKFYKTGEYSLAAANLARVVRTSPSNATAHYMLGNCLLRLKKTAAAKAEYQIAIRLDSSGGVAPYAQKALSALSGQKELAQQAQTLGDFAGADAGNKHLAKTEKPSLVQSKAVDADTLRLLAERNERVSRMVAEGDGRVKALETEMKERIAANGSAAWSGSPLCQRSVKYYDPELENKVIREEYAPKIETIKAEYKKRADEILSVYKQRYGDLDALAGRDPKHSSDQSSAVASATASSANTATGTGSSSVSSNDSGQSAAPTSAAACVRNYPPVRSANAIRRR